MFAGNGMRKKRSADEIGITYLKYQRKGTKDGKTTEKGHERFRGALVVTDWKGRKREREERETEYMILFSCGSQCT